MKIKTNKKKANVIAKHQQHLIWNDWKDNHWVLGIRKNNYAATITLIIELTQHFIKYFTFYFREYLRHLKPLGE